MFWERKDYMPEMQIRLIENAFNVGSHNHCIELLSSSTHLFNKYRQAAAYIGVVHAHRKPPTDDSEVLLD